MTERVHFHFSFSCIGEGNGYPLQCSCLENSRDGGAWWAAVYGVAQGRTRLERLSSSSSFRGSRCRKAGHILIVAETTTVPKLHFVPLVKVLQPESGYPDCTSQPYWELGDHVTKLSMTCEQKFCFHLWLISLGKIS